MAYTGRMKTCHPTYVEQIPDLIWRATEWLKTTIREATPMLGL